MFDWLFTSCPVDQQAQQWIEQRMRWLTLEFGDSLLLDAPNVTPTEEFFPDKYNATDDSARKLVSRIGKYMHVPDSSYRLEFYSEEQNLALVNHEGYSVSNVAAGLYGYEYGQQVIKLNRSDLPNPMAIVGTIAHEMAHARLLGENRSPADMFDNELITDLTVVFHGLGIFLANTPRNWRADDQTWPGTELRRPEYMSLPMFGYALALRSQLRFEESPKWIKYLKGGVRSEFKQAVRYMNKRREK